MVTEQELRLASQVTLRLTKAISMSREELEIAWYLLQQLGIEHDEQ